MTQSGRRYTRAVLIATVIGAFFVVHANAASLLAGENFTTTTARDGATTAVWDTIAKEVRLPPGATSWSLMTGLPDQEVFSFGFSPAYAADGTIFAGIWDGIIRSTNNGASWSRVATTANEVMDLGFSPAFASDGIAFAITNGDGLWRTTNGGTSWTKAGALISGFGIAVSPAFAADRTVFAAAFNAVYKSTDGGGTWSATNGGISAAVLDNGDLRGIGISRSYASNATAFASALGIGIYRTTNGGTTWSVSNPAGIGIPYASAIATASGNTVAAAFLDAVYLSTDSGASWVKVYDGEVNDIVFSPNYATDGTMLFATTSGAVKWKNGATALASGWPGGAANVVAVSSAYPDARSVVTGRANGAWTTTAGFASSAVAQSKPINAPSRRILTATITPDAVMPGGTSVVYRLSIADGDPSWEGPVTPGQAWTFAANGSSLRWQATLATTTTAQTPRIRSLSIAYETDDTLPAPTPAGATPQTTSIRWNFVDQASDETGFAVVANGTTVVTTAPTAVQDFTYLDESGLTPNTEYCNRRVRTLRGNDVSELAAAYPCTVTLAATPPAPLITEVTPSSLRLALLPGSGNPTDTVYSIEETTTKRFLSVNGTLTNSAVWQMRSAWGEGQVTVLGLATNTPYTFCVRARNRVGTATACSPGTSMQTGVAAVPRGDLTIAIRSTSATPPSRGAEASFAVDIAQVGDGSAHEVTVSIPIPSGVASVPGTLRRNEILLTDVRDGDAGDVGVSAMNTVTFQLGRLDVGAISTLAFSLSIGMDAASATLAPSVRYRPLSDLDFRTVSAAPLTMNFGPVPVGQEPPPPDNGAPPPIVGGGAPPPLTLTVPEEGAATNAQTIVVRGQGPVFSNVSISLNGIVVGAVPTTSTGMFTYAFAQVVPEGAQTVEASATVAGRPLNARTSFVVDRTPPAPPSIRQVRVSDRRVSTTRADTFDVTIELSGAIEQAEFSDIDVLLITIASDPTTYTFRPSGSTWTFRSAMALAPGGHSVRVAARDRAGNVSPTPTASAFEVTPAQCGDGLDNDGDGFIDFPNDPDCRGVVDDLEATEGLLIKTVTTVRDATTVTAKVVAETTTKAARVTAKAAERAAAIVETQVLDNPNVEVATERIVAPAVVVAVAANTATAVQGFQLLSYLQYLLSLLLQPGRLLSRRRRKGWGTVYGSLTKRPVDLATVRLLDAKTGAIVQSAVTDHLGRYAFQVKRAGTYRMEVRHPKFSFPSSALAARSQDSVFTDLYHGGSITVETSGTFVTANIPLDAKEETSTSNEVVRRHYKQLIGGSISNVGLVLSFVSVAVSPRWHVVVICAVNVLLYLVFRRLAKHTRSEKSWGSVLETFQRQPIHLAIVRLFDKEFNKLLETAVTDRYGRYSFLTGKSVYYVTAVKQGYEQTQSDDIDLTGQEAGVVKADLKLRRAHGASPPAAVRSEERTSGGTQTSAT